MRTLADETTAWRLTLDEATRSHLAGPHQFGTTAAPNNVGDLSSHALTGLVHDDHVVDDKVINIAKNTSP